MTERKKSTISREAVLSEIEAWRTKSRERFSWHVELNNFHCYLPSDEWADEGGRQACYFINAAGWMDEKNDDTHKSEVGRSYHSDLFLSQTPREFFRTIDETIEETPGVALEEIRRLQSKYYGLGKIMFYPGMPPEEEEQMKKRNTKKVDVLHRMYEYVLPLYVELRVRGYSQFDLTG